tara:strand:+ start:814 stop:2955 length:2142 start_codon:yes stop_codon:yes gene_type:complete
MSNETIYSEKPFVATYNGIITDEECEHFIKISKDSLTTALVSSDKKGMVSAGRTGTNTWLNHNRDEITQRVGEKIAKIVGLPLENAEKYQIVHYDPTQQYKQHYDSWDHNGSEKTVRCMKFGGARLITGLVYLNDVEEGGETRLTKLGFSVKPEKGKLLVFHNTYMKETGSHVKHPMSEHAALPVIKGEKYAFNLWFKECNAKMLYSLYNPKYFENITPKINNETTIDNKSSIKTIRPKLENIESIRLHGEKDIYKITNIFDENNNIKEKCNFSGTRRKSGWVKLSNVESIVQRLESLRNFDKSYYENLNVVQYDPGDLHGKHFVAYDQNTENGKKYTQNTGQRMFTMTLVLSDNIEINFPTIDVRETFNTGDLLIYKNTIEDKNVRDEDMERTIINSDSTLGYIANIYIREFNSKGEKLNTKTELNIDSTIKTTPVTEKRIPAPEKHMSPLPSENIDMKITEIENYEDTLQSVLDMFHRGEIGQCWKGYESFKYLFRGNFTKFRETVLAFRTLKYSYSDRCCLIKENLEKEYNLDPDFNLAVVNNVLTPEVLTIFQNFYKENIEAQTWNLGDRQAQRYKCHNEAFSRFLHYETLPLIERITGKKLKPSYTYLSMYVKGADLPGHTDRNECEYTVSFVIDKPKDSSWNIYVDTVKQPIKYKGRYPKNPPKEQCIPVDCEAGGLMMFQGTDRIHFREKLQYDFYNIILLHYMSI